MDLLIGGILEILPHRYPFLLVDRILQCEPGKRAVGIKNVSFNEEFFQGHFPGHPVMPGVLIVEALAQTAAVPLLLSLPDREAKVPYFAGIEACRFRRPVVPGDQLRLEVEITSARTRLSKCLGRAFVGDALCAEATILSSIVDRPR
jgi:3-hydroxyacyl-[acyl-carrier-protein] dehydratase